MSTFKSKVTSRYHVIAKLSKSEVSKLLAGEWYHGTKHGGALIPSKTGRQGPGIYLTSSEKEAAFYAGDEGLIHTYKVAVKNPMIVDEAGGENVYDTLGADTDEALLEKLQSEGYDGIISTADDRLARRKFKLPESGDIGPTTHLVVFDPNLLKRLTSNRVHIPL